MSRIRSFVPRWVCGLGLLALPGLGAAQSVGYLDAYYVPDSRFDSRIGDVRGKEGGDGYGLKGAVTFGSRFFFGAEYQDTSFDDLCCALDAAGQVVTDDQGTPQTIDADLTQLRAGLGMRSDPIGPVLSFVLAEYIRTDLDAGARSEEEDGYGVHAGLRGENGRLGVTVRLGWVDLGPLEGVEYEIESDYRLLDAFGVFVNYRFADLENDSRNLRQEIGDLRVGVTAYFGAP